MSIIHIPEFQPEKPYMVYGILAKDKEKGYVKFGITKNIGSRLSGIRVGCPIPVRYITVVEAGCKTRALIVEKELHKRFENRKITGEWFRFDFSSDEDKRDFNDGSKSVFSMYLWEDSWWTKINMSALAKYEKQRRSELLHSGLYRKLQRQLAEEQKIKKAWKELSY